MAHVVIEIDVPRLAHERYARTDERSLYEFEVPGRRDRARLSHPLKLLFEVVRWRILWQRELEQPADVHRGIARLEREPDGIQWGNLPHRQSCVRGWARIREWRAYLAFVRRAAPSTSPTGAGDAVIVGSTSTDGCWASRSSSMSTGRSAVAVARSSPVPG